MMKQTSLKENQMILPKSYNIIGEFSSPSRAKTSLTPNEKLDLCCRKRRVNPGCQAMCNFEALNDRTVIQTYRVKIKVVRLYWIINEILIGDEFYV
ncbi:unnamed protein product [Strongylus vulgaris]|uniref:Uncharacterized protein n=1 Tax=Strongylus vulgaris TaxID=40348 RepID=A0A3P7JHP9_STRVU|nr:unnamed protein product [Strongylus vulgaris]